MWGYHTVLYLLTLTALISVNDGSVPTFTQDFKVYGSDTASGDANGVAVSISGNIMAATAERDDDGGWDVGAVYLYEFINGTWVELYKIVPGSLDFRSNFGHRVALEGTLLFVSATGESSTYVYDRVNGTDTWALLQTLSGTAGFGADLDISGATAVIAASDDDDKGTNAGALFIFDHGNGTMWAQTAKIYGSGVTGYSNPTIHGDGVSMRVAIDGDFVIRGSPHHDSEEFNAGAVHIFHRHQNGTNVWGEVKKLVAPDAVQQGSFGSDVSICGDILAVGASDRGAGGGNGGMGSVYIFYRHMNGTNSWGYVTQQYGESSDSQFGAAIHLVDNALLVGAYTYGADDSGAAYMYHRYVDGQDAWGQVARFRASTPRPGDGFAADVCMSNGIVAVGASHHDFSSNNGEGSVFMYHGWSANDTSSVCGDGVLYYPEECEDGNVLDGDGCDSNCTMEECGNGVLQASEECDDNNTVNADGCDSNCRIEVCGNGILQDGESCDDGNSIEGDGCTMNCTLEECGDGVLNVGEECDDNNTVTADGCDENCIEEACGNNVVQVGEECDDGNVLDGDGCAFNCTIEADDGATVGTPTVNFHFIILLSVAALLATMIQ